MITDSQRERIYREIEARTPIWRLSCAADGPSNGQAWRRPGVAGGIPDDLAGLKDAELRTMKDRILDSILFELHSVFEIPAEASEVEEAVRQILEERFASELVCKTHGACDAGAYARCYFFERWSEAAATEGNDDGTEPSLWLKALRHIQGVGFFHKSPLEILAWTRRFLELEAYHRLDPVRNEERLDRYRVLRNRGAARGMAHFEDILIWLEMRLMGRPGGAEGSIGPLSREIVHELEGVQWDVLLPGWPVQPTLYVLLRCHQLCLMETLDAKEERRLLQIQANRQIDSLLDLMRLVLYKTTSEAYLPEPSSLLDHLQAEGFNIDHEKFRDPYEALLVPVSETERFEEASLRLLAPLESLSGDWARDRTIGSEQIKQWYQKLLRETTQDVESYLQAGRQPLPQTGVLNRLIRMGTTHVLARRAWPLQEQEGDDPQEAVRKALPEGALRYLIRPRKGYELKTRGDLNALIQAEWSQQCEALVRIAAGYSIKGLHDFRHFTRYLLFQHWMERFGPDPNGWAAPLEKGALTGGVIQTMTWLEETAARWSVDLHRAVPHSLEAVRDHLQEICPGSCVIDRLTDGFVLSQGEKGRIYRGLVEELTPACHKLLVAYGRARAGLGRLVLSSGWREELESPVALLAPTLSSLRERARIKVEQCLEKFARPLYRREQRLCLRSVPEWKAFLAWEIHRWMEAEAREPEDPESLERLRAHLESSMDKVDLPPRTLFTESVQQVLLDLLRPNGDEGEIPREHREAVLSLLPRLDCGACGRSSCRAFALSLAAGQTTPETCVHLAPQQVEALKARVIEVQRLALPRGTESLLDLLRDRNRWRASPERARFQKILSVTEQQGRRLFRERVKSLWERLSPKPGIFRAPSGDEFYQGLCQYLGYEAAERLQRDERQLLVEHGSLRRTAEWERLIRNCDWLVLARRRNQSQPLSRTQDPLWRAREAYQKALFLHQLGDHDRELVLRHRLERFQDGFRHWWNEDLLDMNLPDFSIRDWEDFSKIIKNAYWHQETSLGAGRVLSMLQEAGQRGTALLPSEVAPVQMLEAYLERLIRQEQAQVARRREVLALHRDGSPVCDSGQLRELFEACIDDVGPGESSETSEDQLKLRLEEVWRRFQRAGFVISPGFSCRLEDLLPDEQDAVEDEFARLGKALPRSDRSAFVIDSWDQTVQVCSGFLIALLSTALLRREQERMESVWLETRLKDRSPGRPPLGLIRLLIRDRVRRGIDRPAIEEELKAHLRGAAAYPGLIDAWCEDLLHHLACKRQYQLSLGIPALTPGQVEEDDMDSVLYRFPVFTAFLDRLLDRYQPADRDRLLHYLFLVAKMEGNLDGLTALLREIRETSDIIEAAWLRFTEERVQEGPAPRQIPGATVGISLLASCLKDKEAVNRGLRDGMGRGEKRQNLAAYRELLQVVRYHVLIQDDEGGSLEEVLSDIRRSGYDLTGIDEAALALAVEREWKRREHLRDQKIWIYASVTARLLAAQHTELQEADRAFQKVRMEILKDADGSSSGRSRASARSMPAVESGEAGDRATGGGLAEIMSRRGVALGQIKEEMYRRLSDLLEAERLATFHKRIRQIVEELDRKRVEIQEGWYRGQIDERAVFYLLRQHQKGEGEPSWDDFWQFLVDHGLNPLDELKASRRPDRQQRLQELDGRFRALLGISLLQWEQEARTAAEQDLRNWMEQQRGALA
jgi:hypothetical protein